MALKCFNISIPECNYMAVSWAAKPEKALKDAIKIAFERRGIKVFRLDNREFVAATPFVNYIKKMNRLGIYVTEKAPS